MRTVAIGNAPVALALLASAHSADAHGIAGNRFFVGTLTFDDPSVADEAIVPNFSTLNLPVEGGKPDRSLIGERLTRRISRQGKGSPRALAVWPLPKQSHQHDRASLRRWMPRF
jgi:hypothetical protein